MAMDREYVKEKIFYYQVALKAPLFQPLIYSSKKKLDIGSSVIVPLGMKQKEGFILQEDNEKRDFIKNIKPIIKCIEERPLLSLKRIEWLRWMSDYYYYPLGMVMGFSFPPLSFKEKKEKTLKKEKAKKIAEEISLNSEQKQVVKDILKHSGFKVHLLYGITGSGKTEVYKKLAENSLKKGGQFLFLLPEIFLSPQIINRFSKDFPNEVAVIHSQLTSRKKTNEWWNMIQRKKNILVGTRSSLFCPLPKLSWIIVDEEHETSFKQEDKFRYHARDSAIMLGKILDIPIVLGSASPSLISYFHAQNEKYILHTIKHRALKQKLPQIQVVDLKEKPKLNSLYWLSDPLFLKMKEVLEQKKQIALFLNRRGQASSLICLSCGHVSYCANCDISLTLHNKKYLVCHYCNYMEEKPSRCKECQSDQISEKGLGTEKIEEEIKKLFPKNHIVRVDRDSIDSKKDMESFFESMEEGEIDIIIGTQMLAKGLDFPNLDLVGIILADTAFHFPDFRASEQSFQTLLQISGRAGRRKKGEVILQSFHTEHPSIRFLKDYDYLGFYKKELSQRKLLFYPPFSKLLLFQIEGFKEKKVMEYSHHLADSFKEQILGQIRILGPSPAPIYRIKNFYRYQILLKAPSHFVLQRFLNKILPTIKEPSQIRCKIDRDPVSML